MVNDNKMVKPSRTDAVRRVLYSAVGLSIVGGVVAVLGAPMKWT